MLTTVIAQWISAFYSSLLHRDILNSPTDPENDKLPEFSMVYIDIKFWPGKRLWFSQK